jgi:enoyl-CoA hydratase/carnithine racemase
MDTRVANTIGYEHIQVSAAAAGITTITMNRPERRNALSEAHMRELIAALRAAGDQPDMRAVILGANGSVFCSGHDFADMITATSTGCANCWPRAQS